MAHIVLMRAAELYIDDGRAKFSTYAGKSIDQQILKNIKTGKLIHVPILVQQGQGDLQRVIDGKRAMNWNTFDEEL